MFWLMGGIAVAYVVVCAVVAVWHAWITPPGDIALCVAAAERLESSRVEALSDTQDGKAA